MSSYNPVPSGEGTVTTYPTAGRCKLCKHLSTKLFQVSKGSRIIKVCDRCLGWALRRPKSAGRHY